MSTNLKYKQVVNVTRRTWDVEAYEKRAQDRAKNTNIYDDERRGGRDAITEQVVEEGKGPEEFVSAEPGASGPLSSKRAFLKARTNKIKGLDSKIGSVEIVNPEAMATTKAAASDDPLVNRDSAVTKSGIGWHCKVCDCFLKDSLTYLDHINGRKHQRNLGYSMRVERSTKDQVASRLAVMVKAKERSGKGEGMDQFEEDEEVDFYRVVNAKDEELKRRKEGRKRERKERKKKKKEQRKAAAEVVNIKPKDDDGGKSLHIEGNEKKNDDFLDPNFAAVMGFAGFGGGKKNR